MEIKKVIDIAYPLDTVWTALCDIHLVADCLPGASLTADLGGDRYKGQFKVKVGPLTGAFDGEVAIARHPQTHSAEVSGKGGDAKTSSRVSGSMAYRVEAVSPTTSLIHVNTEVVLAGAFAQFGKAAVIQEIANRITAEFVRNLEGRLAAMPPAVATTSAVVVDAPPPPAPVAPVPAASPADKPALDAGNLFWSILRQRIAAWLRRLSGREAH